MAGKKISKVDIPGWIRDKICHLKQIIMLFSLEDSCTKPIIQSSLLYNINRNSQKSYLFCSPVVASKWDEKHKKAGQVKQGSI